ncbi:target of rapamycin complex 2 subunit MAPKAP1-like [Sycon ciliatum]|uniref:target of rapamycin complex 2 subunit MAPKAP1-like n=1 Tax=Sycon ciliatum TaxID=27933 RepID=UPI0020AA5B83|eukprot:scpid55230/ scgid19904/ Target of rapamycin complex 2 subunit MAPKAP1; Mitogen-activated protein kinase 2-associated protein 1; Stress-activated map kinase-interacting protein 1
MAFFDDPEWMLLHIRHCSVVADDTGMSELVITNDSRAEHDVRMNTRTLGSSIVTTGEQVAAAAAAQAQAEFDADVPQTPAIQYQPTVKHTDRNKKGKAQIKTIKWKDVPTPPLGEESPFVKKDVASQQAKKKRKSLLSMQMESVTKVPSNPFHHFAKCDGELHRGAIPTHSVEIHIPMCTNRTSPIPITVLASCTVRDAIGFIMYKYTRESRKPLLREDLKAYCLRIYEDGEIDMEFPPLDLKENLVKFDFGMLAFTEANYQAAAKKPTHVVTVQMPGSGFSRIQVESSEILMKDLLSRILKKRRIFRTGHEYVLERQGRPGKPVNADATLASMRTFEFCLVKENSLQVRDSGSSPQKEAVDETLTSHIYQTYQVTLLHRLRANTDVQLGISGKRLEVDPVTRRSALFSSKEKPLSYDMASIVYCELQEEKGNGRATFKVLHDTGNDFKTHEFEADTDIAKEIVRKVTFILESSMRTERHREVIESQKTKKKVATG